MINTMKSAFIFFLTLPLHMHLTTVHRDEIEPIELRIKNLKRQIFEETKGQGNKAPYESDHYKDMYDYVDNSNKPIVPISDDDERKLEDRYKMPELKTTTMTEKSVASPKKVEGKTVTEHPLRSKKQKKKKSVETFYRRMAFNPNERDRPQKWTHCLDLLAPFLNGYLSNVTEVKKVFATDHVIRRFRHLLTIDVIEASTEEIRSILYEISNLQLRVFQWDTGAVKAILSVLIKEKPHDFKGLKSGVKALFASWKLNTSNLTRVLTQSRIFRPPCIQITSYAGSTVTPKAIRYSKPKTEKHTCAYTNADEDC